MSSFSLKKKKNDVVISNTDLEDVRIAEQVNEWMNSPVNDKVV